MSEAYQFAIGRSRAFFLTACFAAAALLLFFAGTLTGILYSRSHEASAKVIVPGPAVKAPKAPELKAAELASAPSTDAKPALPAASAPPSNSTDPTAKSVLPNSPPTTPTSTTPSVTTTPTAAIKDVSPSVAGTLAATATSPTSAPDTATTAKSPTNDTPPAKPVEASYAVPLAVRVGSFTVKSNAELLMQSLKDMGYQPAMSLDTDSKGRQWYVIRLGPYTRWNTASQVAARISIAENLTPVIGPMQ